MLFSALSSQKGSIEVRFNYYLPCAGLKMVNGHYVVILVSHLVNCSWKDLQKNVVASYCVSTWE